MYNIILKEQQEYNLLKVPNLSNNIEPSQMERQCDDEGRSARYGNIRKEEGGWAKANLRCKDTSRKDSWLIHSGDIELVV